MIGSVEIRDVAGGQAPGCTASFVIESEQVGYTTYSYIVATATPAAGYVFLRWEYDYYTQVFYSSSQSDPVYHYGVQLDENPSAHEIYDYETDNPLLGARSIRVTTRLVAIFQKTTPPHPATGLILRSSSSGLILRGKANRILRNE